MASSRAISATVRSVGVSPSTSADRPAPGPPARVPDPPWGRTARRHALRCSVSTPDAAPAAPTAGPARPFEIGCQLIGLIRFFTFWPSFAVELGQHGVQIGVVGGRGVDHGDLALSPSSPPRPGRWRSARPAPARPAAPPRARGPDPSPEAMVLPVVSSRASNRSSSAISMISTLPWASCPSPTHTCDPDPRDTDARYAERCDPDRVPDPPAPPRQRAAGDRQPRPRGPVGGGQPLVRRRLPARATRPDRASPTSSST